MANNKLVWSDESGGDVRKSSGGKKQSSVNESQIELKVRRLTSGKGRTVIEIKGLPNNAEWCKELAKKLKKSLGVGGNYKADYIEIHGEKIDDVTKRLDDWGLRWKKTGG